MTVRTSEKAQAKRDMRARVSGGGPGVLARRGASRRPRCSFIFTPRHKLGWGGRGPGPPPRASGGVGVGVHGLQRDVTLPNPPKNRNPVERGCARSTKSETMPSSSFAIAFPPPRATRVPSRPCEKRYPFEVLRDLLLLLLLMPPFPTV